MIDIALKEWACVCDLLVEGKVCLLLRKGGVHEHDGPGRFKLEHDRFALFPAWEHETLEWIKPRFRPDRGPITEEPDVITFCGVAQVLGVWEVKSRAAFDQLDHMHPWLPPQIDMRFNYKPQHPLYAVLIAACRLEQTKRVPNRREFAGCKSWVPLTGRDRIVKDRSHAVIDPVGYPSIIKAVDDALG
ncbi:MAG: DUF1802 family protein [Planctomycetota bacterium]